MQLLAAWLNFANGSIEHDRLVDTNWSGRRSSSKAGPSCPRRTRRTEGSNELDGLTIGYFGHAPRSEIRPAFSHRKWCHPGSLPQLSSALSSALST